MKNNTNTKVAAGLVLGAVLACASSVMANNEFTYASSTGSTINFLGSGEFDFTPSASDFTITSSTLGTAANGLAGGMNGTYTMGAITSPSAGIFEAPVTGSGNFTINDGAGHTLTGTLVWEDIIQSGTGSTVNYLGSVNLTAMTYTGSNPELLTLAGQVSVIDTLNFTETAQPTLATLEAGGTSLATSFSGSINGVTSTPDGGLTIALLGGAFTAMGLVRSKFGKK
jgi:hypothetical protein